MSAPFCLDHHTIMAQAARLAVWALPLPELAQRMITEQLEGHFFYPPQDDLTLSDDEDDIEIVFQSPGPIDSDDDMPVAEAWRRKRPPAAPVKPPARKRLRRAVVYSDHMITEQWFPHFKRDSE